ncbi:MogA/MoaB family molybdenum cofactor biosynthesis protein [Phormidium pseudopriestleyi FRX01]|uniref:Molybdenum cofactor biosynthesis protein B n=1 Tax=Phormidium pseudopriestleyi FRX01 TaxID=1759528 RepID=A0ABS3FXE9_9CYAN|nr:MogA/MoaB family molybdenum cofactor biosynthesis protein [Phormidium pseudopriestleyi]MBO0351748.1 MogA/MoaB family molybdenum cofactor biosynthesis protein [Phormidium pseudopriestleyi FRX01]
MTNIPHPDSQTVAVNCAIVTISDTRTPETDRSGQLIQALLLQNAHAVVDYTILPDEPAQIQGHLIALGQRPELEAVIFNGGTGIAPRDTTYDAIALLLEKTLPGFGEIFRALSYQEIGSRAIASRAIAGLYQSKLIFSIPGSTGAVKLALNQLILPELIHLTQQVKSEGH